MRAVVDGIRAAVATTAIGIAGYVGAGGGPFALQGPSLGGTVPTATEPILEYAIRQGGALAVLVIVLFFYRRDYRYLSEFWRDQSKLLLELVAANTKAQADTASALAQNTVVVHQAKNVMQNYLPQRRAHDGQDGETPEFRGGPYR